MNTADTLTCRSVTSEEIAHYQANGWAKLDRYISREFAANLLAMAQENLGIDANGNAVVEGGVHPYFNLHVCNGFDDPVLRQLVIGNGCNAKMLMARGNGSEIRYFTDFFAAKLPANKTSTVAGNERTDRHQDFPDESIDRAGGMGFWIALTDLEPDSGTMHFLNGSHTFGPLGSHSTHVGRDVTDTYPRLLEKCSASTPMRYRAGDATVHSNLCVHGAGPNKTDRPRWAYIMACNPADARWTGAPSSRFTASVAEGLQPFDLLDDGHFPIISI